MLASHRVAVDLLRNARPGALQRGLGLAPPRLALQQQHRRLAAAHFTEFSLTADDKLDIMELCHKFDATINAGQQDKLGSFFAPEAEVITPAGQVKGLPAILEYFDRCRPLAQGKRHLTSNIIVEADGVNAARVSAYRILHAATNPPTLLAAGTIEDRLVSVNGEWRFVQRKFLMDPPAAAAAPQQQQQQPQQPQQPQQAAGGR